MDKESPRNFSMPQTPLQLRVWGISPRHSGVIEDKIYRIDSYLSFHYHLQPSSILNCYVYIILHQNANHCSGLSYNKTKKQPFQSPYYPYIQCPIIYLVLDATPAPITPGSFSDPMLNIIPMAQLTIPIRRALKPAMIQNCALISCLWHAAPPQ